VTRLERNVNIAAVIVPFLGVIAGAALAWERFLAPRDVVIFAAMYLLTAIGVTVGFHRLLTHRSFQTYAWLRYALAALGSMSLQGPAIDWVADHRKHHTFTDEEGDPHSPHAGHGAGLRGMARGLWHAHVGWLFRTHGQASSRRFARDLVEDATMRRVNRAFPWLAAASLLIPFLLGLALGAGSLLAGLSALLWGGLVRIFLVHHITWSINSICHFFGRRRFQTDDHSRNVFWLALPSLGEAWHHNHHAFPRSAFHGLRWYELDPSGWLILALARVGLAWDVVRVSPEQARAKLADAEPVAGARPSDSRPGPEHRDAGATPALDTPSA
jgi:stearoyl-CoA desaturase (delta-9 desaturase)